MWPRAKLQVPSRILLSHACEEVQTTADLLGTETALTLKGEKPVLVCLRVTSSFRKCLLKILVIILILSSIFPYISNFTMAPDAALQVGTSTAISNTPAPPPSKKKKKRITLVLNSMKYCKNLHTSPPPCQVETHQACGFWYLSILICSSHISVYNF